MFSGQFNKALVAFVTAGVTLAVTAHIPGAPIFQDPTVQGLLVSGLTAAAVYIVKNAEKLEANSKPPAPPAPAVSAVKPLAKAA